MSLCKRLLRLNHTILKIRNNSAQIVSDTEKIHVDASYLTSFKSSNSSLNHRFYNNNNNNHHNSNNYRQLSQLVKPTQESRAFLVDTLALSVMAQEANLSKFKSEVKSSQLNRETEKLRNDIDKMHNELRFEIDKVTAGLRLDLNLERGRIKDELANQTQRPPTSPTNSTERFTH